MSLLSFQFQARGVAERHVPSVSDIENLPAANLKDGLYLILREGTERKALVPLRDGESLVLDDYKYLEVKPEEPPEYLVIRSAPDVPLILEDNPRAERDVNGRTKLYLTLSSKYVDKLERLTRDNLGSRVAVLVGGEIVSTHKIKSVIKDGRLQLTRCTDNACEYLLLRLKKS